MGLLKMGSGLLAGLGLAALAAGLVGCGNGVSAGPVAVSASGLTGQVHGGQQPVSGSAISLYAAGAAGDGLGALSLLTTSVTTNDGGSFGITGDYTCPSSQSQVYLVARGGNPGLAKGTNNPALVMMAALGNCGALTSSTFISVNERTTVAAAWALAQFMAAGAQVGASGTNATGLRNAFLTAATLVNPANGSTPGASLPAGTQVETAKLNTLADVLAVCVNSDGGGACQGLFSAATAGGVTPGNTLDAALNVVRNPASNVGTVFGLIAAQPPFQPALTTAPNDWTMSVTHGLCATGCGGLNVPGALAIDSTGSVWVANYFGGVVSKFGPTGIPAAADGFAGAGLHESYGMTVDGQDAAWVTNENSVTAAGNGRSGSVSRFDSTGVELSGAGYTAGAIFYPVAVAAAPSGQVWVANYGSSSATLLNADGSSVSGASSYAPGALPFTSAVAVDGAGNGWFSVQGGVAKVTPDNKLSSFACCSVPSGVTVDGAGQVWLTDYGTGGVVKFSAAGTVIGGATGVGGLAGPQSVAIDGAGTVWVTNYRGDSITALNGATLTAISPKTGFGVDAGLVEPYGLGVDASGNVWVSNAGSSTLTQFVGVAKGQ